MYLLTKYFHPYNFAFAHRYQNQILTVDVSSFEARIVSAPGDIHHISLENSTRRPPDVRVEKPILPFGDSGVKQNLSTLEVTPDAGMRLKSETGRVLLEGVPDRWFGVCGSQWLFQFKRDPEMQFYGLGEKQAPFERSGRAYTFWNVDVWADHPMEQVKTGEYDPDYIAVPYLIIKRGNTFIGLLSDNPYPGVISISQEAQVAEQLKISLDSPPAIVIGAEAGVPSLYCIYGPSLAELTRKFQMLTGATPLPPLWALGYHQSRWGYAGETDLTELADRFEEYEFPCDGLWLDIDYMDGFRVFTFNQAQLPRPAQTVSALKKRGFRVVPILDPGVKREKTYGVYGSGRLRNLFCLTEAGVPFVGMVWPGFTVFPDFALSEAREWWARYARDFFDTGFEGAWLDMNDPSTGPVDPTAMRFEEGRTEHAAYHNQYALLMAKATLKGLTESRPGQRPFLLSRSGSTGSQKYAAHWTGDNFSNYHHLHRSIGKSINLALSGIPFNGPDVGGFGGHCEERLLIDWIKAAFLFPFFRNHTMRGSRGQEPWAYSPEALDIIRRYVRLRYRLMPYLYNLFIDQEETGEAILRPLFYDFEDTRRLSLSRIDDQFLVGPSILQAPFVHETGDSREVALPPGQWLAGETGRWSEGDRKTTANRAPGSTPLFFREGGLIPFQPGETTDNRHDLNRIGLFCCISPSFRGETRYLYRTDDGISFDYRRGGRTAVEIIARVEEEDLLLSVDYRNDGYGPVFITPFTVDRFSSVILEGDGSSQRLQAEEIPVRLTGERLTWYRWNGRGF
ncbi:MAG: glycoside hydrolase family 31 protein [Desulfococcaceae bacterium]